MALKLKQENNKFLVKGSKGELIAPINEVVVNIDKNIIRVEPKENFPK